MSAQQALLSIRDLVIEFQTPDGVVNGLNGVSLDVYPQETLGLVGETGSGKSLTAAAVMGLVPCPPGVIRGGAITFGERDLLGLSRESMRHVRGSDVALVFQDPLTALNPVMRVGAQVAEALRAHQDISRRAATIRAVELLAMVGMPDAGRRSQQYPHELSGGLRQRVVIAIAIANQPKLLIADEPTTALDVTIQAQVLELLGVVQRQSHAAMILITHDLGVIAERADRVAVMYGGRIVEYGDTQTLFAAPAHPYTQALLSSIPRLDDDVDELRAIPGSPPDPVELPRGCTFHPRCSLRRGRELCVTAIPELEPVGHDAAGAIPHLSACHFVDEMRSEQHP